MQKDKTPVAGTEKPQTGTRRNNGVTINVNSPNTDTTGNGRDNPPQAQQPNNPANPPQADGTEELPKPVIYAEPQVFRDNQGHSNKRYATPLAATVFERFDPNYRGEQPAENYHYVDRDILTRGHL